VAEERERIKRMAEFRTLLEKRIQKAEDELKRLRVFHEFVEAALLEKELKRVEAAKPVSPPPTPPQVAPTTPMEHEEAVPLKTVTGELLANLYVGEDSMRVVLVEDKEFNVNTPPFTAFLVDRVLAKMQEKDREAAMVGEITPDRVLSYHIARDGDTIREIFIQNVTPDRSRELKSAIRWTLERMWEKMSMKTS